MVNVEQVLRAMEATAKAEGTALHPSGLPLYARWNCVDGTVSWILTDNSGPACLPITSSVVGRHQAERYLREKSGICTNSFGALK